MRLPVRNRSGLHQQLSWSGPVSYVAARPNCKSTKYIDEKLKKSKLICNYCIFVG